MARSAGFSASRLARLSAVLQEAVDQGAMAGLVALLARGDEVHVEALGVQDLAAATPMRRDSIFRIASMTKPVTAVAALMLVEEGRLRLDEAIDRWLPELAQRRVLRARDAALEDTVPAERPISVRDLMTFRAGWGVIMAPPGTYPIQKAMAEAGLAPGPQPLSFGPDEFLRRLGRLPLLHQPGAQWLYHTASEVLGVLIARVAGQPFEAFLAERIFGPLGMRDTGFSVAPAKLDRLATSYQWDAASGRLAVSDPAAGGFWSRPPAFAAGGGGLVATADDFLAFAGMLLRGGRHGGERLLARSSIAAMTTDQITPAQKAVSPFFPGFWERSGWGFGVSVITRRDGIAAGPGAYGWMGGRGTAWSNDPNEDMVTMLLTQRLMQGPDDTTLWVRFLNLAYAALED
jgi:CubicO group peptidase (beta-lactamase class C family)